MLGYCSSPVEPGLRLTSSLTQRLGGMIGCSGEPGPDPEEPIGRPFAVVPTVGPMVGLNAGPPVVELLPCWDGDVATPRRPSGVVMITGD